MYYPSEPLSTRALVISIASIVLIMALAVLLLNPMWETNDDLAMSMIAHGYGFSAYPSPNLLFSNVIWGELVQIVPSVLGIRGYALSSYLTLMLSASVVFALLVKRIGLTYAFVFVCLIYLKPVLEPQFTLNSGLLALASVGALIQYFEDKRVCWLLLYGLLFFLAYLIRSQEAFLVMGLAAPFLISKRELLSKPVFIASFVTLGLVFLAFYFDMAAYQGSEWFAYSELNSVRAAFTDFGALSHVIKSPDLIRNSLLTENDLALVQNWFFVDPAVANPKELGLLLERSDFVSSRLVDLSRGLSGIKQLLNPYFSLLLLAALAVLFGRISRQMAMVWFGLIAVAFLLGLVDRAHTHRVFYPLAVLLILLPYFGNIIASARQRVVNALVAFLLIVNALLFGVVLKAKFDARVDVTAVNLTRYDEAISVWGNSFPYEKTYAIREDESLNDVSYLALGTSSLAPYSEAVVARSRGDGFLDRLHSSSGLLLIAQDKFHQLLKTYCDEHFGLQSYRASNNLLTEQQFSLVRVSCATSNDRVE